MQYKTAAIICTKGGHKSVLKGAGFWKVTRSRASDFFQNIYTHSKIIYNVIQYVKKIIFFCFSSKKSSKSLQFYVVSGFEKGLKSVTVTYIKYTLLWCLPIMKTILSTMPVGPIRLGIMWTEHLLQMPCT